MAADVPSPSPFAAELATGVQHYRERLAREFGALWQRVLLEARRPAPVTRLWCVYNEGYLLRGAGSTAPLLAIDLVAPRQIATAARQHVLDSLPGVAGLLVTHRHGDHMDADVIRRFLAAGVPVLLPDDAWQGLRDRLGLSSTPAGLRTVTAGDEADLGGFAIRVHAADHRSKNVAESVAYEVHVDGVTILQAADHRGFDAAVETWPREADLAILSVYHNELDDAGDLPGLDGLTSDEAWLARFRWDQHPGLQDTVERLAPRAVLLGHLYELGHEPEKLWRFVDTGLIREALFSVVPHTAVWTLAPGQCLPLIAAG